MTETEEATASNVGYTVRDLVIQANTKLDSVSGEMKEIRAEQARLRTEVDVLKTAHAVGKAESGTTGKLRNATYALAVLLAYWFGPVIDKAITH